MVLHYCATCRQESLECFTITVVNNTLDMLYYCREMHVNQTADQQF